jgi:flagellar biosynthesis GTPase FlhF
LTPKEIRENNIALLRSHGQEVPHNISKANLEKLIAELNDSPDENNTSIENATLENENTSDKDVKIVPEVDIVWADAE